MQRLSGIDAAFLALETPAAHMHVGGIGIFDPSTSPEPYSFQRVFELTAERLHLAPPFRQRLATVPFGVHHPVWFEDPDFDLAYHFRRAAVPSPGGRRELFDLAADIMSRPLDRNRPLWEIHVVEGLEGGCIASVSKIHHAAIDGVSGMDLTVALLDLQPDPPPVTPPAEPWRPERHPSDAELVAYAARSLARQPLDLGRAVASTARGALAGRRVLRDAEAPPPGLRDVPRASFNRRLTPHRRFAGVELALDDVKKVRKALGGTVNDVVLALCAGALRRYLDDRGEVLDRDLVAMVPISVRTDEQAGAMGNQISSMSVKLGTTVDDPVDRLLAITAATRSAKELHHAVGARTLQSWAEFAMPAVANRAARLWSSTGLVDRVAPPYNVVISNVPGPPFPLYSYGAQLVANFPMGPLNEGNGLNITVTSHLDRMMVGVHACRELVDDPWTIAEGVEAALAELLERA